MPQIRWSPAFETGNATIDAQHRSLFDLVERLERLDVLQDGTTELDALWDELGGYVRLHFAFEEEWMHRKGYAALEEHQAQHQELAQRLEELRQAHDQGEAVLERLQTFMGTWLVVHIMQEDMAYARSLGIQPQRTEPA